MHISIATLFPQMFESPLKYSILARAQKQKHIHVRLFDIRNHATDKHRSVDDAPYGGGVGMVLKVDVVDRALSYIRKTVRISKKKTCVILLDPGGKPFTQKTVKDLSRYDHLILICGHYEGVDDRIRTYIDMELSIGDYVLTGGEIPALVIVDTVTRLIPGVLKDSRATAGESFTTSTLLEYPQYTRPSVYKKKRVPSVLISGNHQEILRWQTRKALERTRTNRPDLATEQKKDQPVKD